ncbi:hypothetical protein HDU96_002869 [Phlyctochytrium bullatum]|nr:hypothetical protein HDU96_002869 [Phlyctochytrium bullatum]
MRKNLYTQDIFTCLDGSKKIDAAAVNDDYCDCPDGSDEPDSECCDGSDEYSGIVKCPNLCAKVGAEHKKAEQQKKKLIKEGEEFTWDPFLMRHVSQWEGKPEHVPYFAIGVVMCLSFCVIGFMFRVLGLRIKKDNIAFAKRSRADRGKQIEDLKLEIGNVTSRIEELIVIKADAEVFEHQMNAVKARKDAEASLKTMPEKLSRCRASKQDLRSKIETLNYRVHQLRAALDHFASLQNVEEGAAFQALLRDKPILKETLDLYDQYKIDNGAEDTPIVVETDPEDNEEIPLLDSYGGDTAESAAGKSKHDIEIEDPCADISVSLSECTSQSFKAAIRHVFVLFAGPAKWSGWRRGVHAVLQSFSKVTPSEEAQLLRADPPKARAKLSEAESRKSQLENQLEDLKRKETLDYGPEGEWEKLEGQCITFDTPEYTYEVCFHKNASQKAKSGGSTDLGRFTRFGARSGSVDESKKYLYMVFEHGQHCWNGPARSVEVELECGTENKILTVTEPSKCEYAMRVTSPNACIAIDRAEKASKAASQEHSEL